MDQEYKADVCCPRNTSAAEVDNSVEKLTGNSTVRKAGSDEISLGDSQTNETNDHTCMLLMHNNSVSKYLIYAILVQCFKMKYNVYVYKV
jgi:hypothetical protein